MHISRNSSDMYMCQFATIQTGTGPSGNSRLVHQVNVVTGQTGIDQCGNRRDCYR